MTYPNEYMNISKFKITHSNSIKDIEYKYLKFKMTHPNGIYQS